MRSLHIVFASIAVGLTILLLLVSVVVPGETNAIQSRSIGYALNLGHGATRDSQVHQAAVRFAQNIARLTNGRVEVNVHPRNALGSDHALVEMARKGDLDFVISPSSVLSIASPSLHFPELPFYFSSSSELDHLLDGAVGTELTTDLREVGLHGLGFWYGGSKHILARKPVTSLADFDGLRIQISPSRLVREQMAHLGAKPLILKKSDTHAALLLDKISGVEGSLTDLLRVQISSQEQGIKPLDYLSLTEHGYQSLVLTASAGLIRKLPESIKLAIFESARDATQWQRQKTLRQSSDLIKQIESQGTKVVSLSGQERNQIAHRLKTMIERYEPEIGANILVKADQYFFDEYGPQADGVDHFVIGINANFSSASTNGLALKQGLLIAVDEINQAGGLFGKPLYILAKNHKQSASLRAHNLNSLQNRDDMLAIFEGGTSNQPITLKPERSQPFYFYVANDNHHQLTMSHQLGMNGMTELREHAIGMLVERLKQRGETPIFVIENTWWARQMLYGIETDLAGKEGHEPINSALVLDQASDTFYPFVRDTVESSIDQCLVLIGSTSFSERMLRALRTTQVKIPVLSVLNEPSIYLYRQNKQLLQNMDITFLTTSKTVPADLPSQRLLSQKLRGRFSRTGEALASEAVAINAYQQMLAFADTLRAAPSFDRDSVFEMTDFYAHHNNNLSVGATHSPQVESTEKLYLARLNQDGMLIPLEHEE